MKRLKAICDERGAQLNLRYWETRTREILEAKTNEEALIVPARAGAGKSTWILAFLLALCELRREGDELAQALGGVLLVFQKVETLNETVTAINKVSPPGEEPLIIALQGWSESGRKKGFCANQQVSTWRDCRKSGCAFAASCPLLRFIQQAPAAFILGVTQARFSMLRQNDGIQTLLLRETEDHRPDVPRRFLIFNEKFALSQTAVLSTSTISRASAEVDALVGARDVTDHRAHQLQKSLGYHVEQPFRTLREEMVFDRGDPPTDMPVGLCSLRDIGPERREGYLRFRTLLTERRPDLSTPHLRDCLAVMDALYEGKSCLFTKGNGFSIFHSTGPELCYGEAQTILFDATAEVDGDYRYLKHTRFLKGSPPLHMSLVHIHLFSHLNMNVSKSALVKPWKLPAFTDLTKELMARYPGPLFLCAYREHAEYLAKELAPELGKRLPLVEREGRTVVPYFGGVNGSNDFHHCTNVILLGYPRLPPHSYLEAASAAWGEARLLEEIRDAQARMETCEHLPRKVSYDLPSVRDYENCHLAARMEQEIYRCALRNRDCDRPLHIFLFYPPQGALDILLHRFHGSTIIRHDELPDCIALQKNTQRLYDGQPTAFARLAEYLEAWDGQRVNTGELRSRLEISPAVWKDLMKDARVMALFARHGAMRSGRGGNATLAKVAEVA